MTIADHSYFSRTPDPGHRFVSDPDVYASDLRRVQQSTFRELPGLISGEKLLYSKQIDKPHKFLVWVDEWELKTLNREEQLIQDTIQRTDRAARCFKTSEALAITTYPPLLARVLFGTWGFIASIVAETAYWVLSGGQESEEHWANRIASKPLADRVQEVSKRRLIRLAQKLKDLREIQRCLDQKNLYLERCEQMRQRNNSYSGWLYNKTLHLSKQAPYNPSLINSRLEVKIDGCTISDFKPGIAENLQGIIQVDEIAVKMFSYYQSEVLDGN